MSVALIHWSAMSSRGGLEKFGVIDDRSGARLRRGLALDLSEEAKKLNTVSRTGVTTTTFLLGRSAGHALFQLAPSTFELVVPLIAFAVIATVMGVLMVRRRLG
jgi:hypothetical protein